ncbi:hypothetical protein HDU97_005856 [Phlyctochytrium planicorne]|nr:hypothetical protein HDU97_005856 [Phlyctochytrium planicorne]
MSNPTVTVPYEEGAHDGDNPFVTWNEEVDLSSLSENILYDDDDDELLLPSSYSSTYLPQSKDGAPEEANLSSKSFGLVKDGGEPSMMLSQPSGTEQPPSQPQDFIALEEGRQPNSNETNGENGEESQTCLGLLWTALSITFPVLTWLPKYKLSSVLADLLAGLTLSTLVVPQAMAYAVMASMPAVYGLYTSIVPTSVYFLTGLSPFQNIGTFAVTSVMVSDFTTASHDWLLSALNQTNISSKSSSAPGHDSSADIAIPSIAELGIYLTFLSSIILLLAWLFGIGSALAHLLPASLVSGINASLKGDTAGTEGGRGGMFAMFKAIWNVLSNFHDIHVPTFLIALSAFAFILGSRFLEKLIRARLYRKEQHQSLTGVFTWLGGWTKRKSSPLPPPLMSTAQRRRASVNHLVQRSEPDRIPDNSSLEISHSGTSNIQAVNKNREQSRNLIISIEANVVELNGTQSSSATIQSPNSGVPFLDSENTLSPTSPIPSRQRAPTDQPKKKPPSDRPILPDVLLAIILSTTITALFDLPDLYNVKVIGQVPSGIPRPSLPWAWTFRVPALINLLHLSSSSSGAIGKHLVFQLTLRMLLAACILAIVAYVTTVSITKTFVVATSSKAAKDLSRAQRSFDALARAPPSELPSHLSKSPGPSSSSNLASQSAPSSTLQITDTAPVITHRRRVPSASPDGQLTKPAEDASGVASVANVELLSLGLSAFIGSFFLCYMPSGSISRSALLAGQTDTKSHFASLTSVIIVILVLICFAQVLENVPVACLALIIILAMSRVLFNVNIGIGLVRQATESWRKLAVENSPMSPIESTIRIQKPWQDKMKMCAVWIGAYREPLTWWITFSSVLVLDAGTGVAIGMAVVLLLNCLSSIQKKQS